MPESSRALTSPLSRERVVDEALAVADSDGFQSLSLRAVARRVGVTPMALYRYVASSDELADLVVSRLVEDHTTDLDWPDDPRDALRLLASTVVGLIRSHPAMLERYERRGVFTDAAMAVVERLLGILSAAGLSGPEAVRAYTAVHHYALGFAALSTNREERAPSAAPDPGRFPVLAAHFDAWTSMRDEEQFRAALDVVITAVLGDR